MEAVRVEVGLKLEVDEEEEDVVGVLLSLLILLHTLYYHYNILLRFLYFGEEEMATARSRGCEDGLRFRRSLPFLFSAFGG